MIHDVFRRLLCFFSLQMSAVERHGFAAYRVQPLTSVPPVPRLQIGRFENDERLAIPLTPVVQIHSDLALIPDIPSVLDRLNVDWKLDNSLPNLAVAFQTFYTARSTAPLQELLCAEGFATIVLSSLRTTRDGLLT